MTSATKNLLMWLVPAGLAAWWWSKKSAAASAAPIVWVRGNLPSYTTYEQALLVATMPQTTGLGFKVSDIGLKWRIVQDGLGWWIEISNAVFQGLEPM